MGIDFYYRICIARLYGGGSVHIPPKAIPTVTRPLDSFPYSFSLSASAIPVGHHPASPRFLISLLATALYLSMPSLASQTLSSILNTVGPYTVLEYHKFALGEAIGPATGEPEAAVGLEHVAHLIYDDEENAPLPVQHTKGEDDASDVAQSFLALNIRKEDPSSVSRMTSDSSLATSNDDEQTINQRDEPTFHYGSISDKIGEATSCWLARWGPDFLAYEVRSHEDGPSSVKKLASTFSSLRAKQTGLDGINPNSEITVPVIWGSGGLNAKWVRALVSSDALFVKNERERYNLARSVVELRRQQHTSPDEEIEWSQMFEHSIYYANMVSFLLF